MSGQLVPFILNNLNPGIGGKFQAIFLYLSMAIFLAQDYLSKSGSPAVWPDWAIFKVLGAIFFPKVAQLNLTFGASL